jgi:hypothetical protein
MIPSQFDNAPAAEYRCTSFNDDMFGSRCDVPQRAPASSPTSSRRRVGPRRCSIAVHDVITQSATWSGETICRDAVAEPPSRSSSSFAPPSSSSRRARLSSPSAHSTSTSIRRRVSKRRVDDAVSAGNLIRDRRTRSISATSSSLPSSSSPRLPSDSLSASCLFVCPIASGAIVVVVATRRRPRVPPVRHAPARRRR